MKRLITAISILLVSAALSVLSLFYLNSVKNKITSELYEISSLIEKENLPAAAARSDELYNYYSEINDILVVFLEHERLEELEETLSRLSPLIASGDLGEFSAEISKAETLSEKLYDHEQPKLKNIL
ncbi:MAG: DUF4363 family protein [Oscillospiraceae bacterium]|nr:DUF4363 family protein [Oscillospiraceae bacterium]